MKVTIIPGQELSDDLVGTWTRLQKTNPDLASPYFHPEYTKIIAQIRQDVEIAIYHGLICSREFQFSPRKLLKQSRLVTWNFDHLPTSQSSFTPFQWGTIPSPQIDLSNGYQAYVEERRSAGSEHIKKIGNLIRRIERESGPLRFVAESTDTAGLAAVLGWKSQQYRETGKPDLFAVGWIHEAVQRIFRARAAGCSGSLSLLYAGDQLVASHLGMRSLLRWHYWFPSYDPRMARYSPGLILLLKMAEHAPSINVPIIDLGAGLSAYKQRFMNSMSLLGRVEPVVRLFGRKLWRMLRHRVDNSLVGPPTRLALASLRRQ